MKILVKPSKDGLYISKNFRCMDDVGQYADCRLIYNDDGDYCDYYCASDALFQPSMVWMSDDWFDIHDLEPEFM